MIAPLLRRGALALRCGGGVLTDISNNTPLHPSQEGNRTALRFLVTPFSFFYSLNAYEANGNEEFMLFLNRFLAI
jgi:hypothetical protein